MKTQAKTDTNDYDITDLLNQPSRILPPILLISVCFKIILMPTYRSTDFDVHRNWLAVTHNLPLSEWYFNDVNGTTVHTLDYPPMFAYFEAFLSNNPLTSRIVPLGDRCLDLLPDSDNTPSEDCIVFHRCTVIASDLIFWIGAYMACRSMYHGKPLYRSSMAFLLIVWNPGMLWLDHIHFQYNGMLLGLFLGSLGLLMQGNNLGPNKRGYHFCHLGGAILYAFLLNLKHLYLTLAPLYFCYLLMSYCQIDGKGFQLRNFAALASVTAICLLAPWVPFLLQEDPKGQLLQILARLFPFGRGLVHDYWAANVWALYLLADKVVKVASPRLPWIPISHLPEPTPLVCAVLMFVSQLPALIVASTRRSNVKLIQAVVYCSLCSFMFAWHVHEKAIMTALIPLTLLVCQNDDRNNKGYSHSLLFWQMSLWGLLGLFPLLFRPVELGFKVVSYVTFMALCVQFSKERFGSFRKLCSLLVGIVIIILEVLPIQGKWEFLPLMITSIICALGLVACWIVSLAQLLAVEDERIKDKNI
ncbi:unnamed protein product [Cylindrotheca closterium]|uniref:Alpha-1,3-glucosyltransferase n=1 Tax=Cylindrotheca closterium TaxID=2856 RepID=A0AAD2G0I9_9STRA|nr:unnamed protein product [Cylindrotheca closterium]